MVGSFKNRGLLDWKVQRVSALYLILYFIPLLYLLFSHGADSYLVWHRVFHHVGTKIATIVALVAIALHAWVGLWTVLTDYVKCTLVRLVFQFSVIVILIVYVAWGLWALWAI